MDFIDKLREKSQEVNVKNEHIAMLSLRSQLESAAKKGHSSMCVALSAISTNLENFDGLEKKLQGEGFTVVKYQSSHTRIEEEVKYLISW